MNVEIGTKAAQHLYWEYINGIFAAVQSIRPPLTQDDGCRLIGVGDGGEGIEQCPVLSMRVPCTNYCLIVILPCIICAVSIYLLEEKINDSILLYSILVDHKTFSSPRKSAQVLV
jgi:hypothetical protein